MPSRPTSSTVPSPWTISGSGWPPQASSSRTCPGHDLHVGVGDGAEAPVGDLLAQRAVQQREHAARAVLVGGRRAQRVAGERGHRRRLGALALDVADQRGPAAVAGAEEVVEVAAELDALAGGVEAHGGGEARAPRAARPAAASAAACARSCARAGTGGRWRSRTDASPPSWVRIASSRGGELALRDVDDLERAEVGAPARAG